MAIKQQLIITVSLLAIALGGFTLWIKLSEKKQGYVSIQTVFDEFDYTKDVRKKITAEQQIGIRIIDSLKQQIPVDAEPGANDEKIEKITYLRDQLVEREKAITADYNAKIWLKLNKYLNEFGAEEKYSFLFGAEGSGSLMYADSSLNVTREAIEYINKKYADVLEK